MRQAAPRVEDFDTKTKQSTPNNVSPDVSKPANEVLDTKHTESDLPMATIIRGIIDKYDRSHFELLGEIAKLSFGESKIAPDEYIEQRLFDSATLKSDVNHHRLKPVASCYG
jgi:hypothetical protein